jgi:hypothetical protein
MNQAEVIWPTEQFFAAMFPASSFIRERTMRAAVIAALWVLSCGIALGAWAPPVGIPMPPTGLEPDRASPAQASQCPNWPGAVQSQCYFIDNAHPQATDTSNPNGYPDKPRATLPGSVTFIRIEIVGGVGRADYIFTARTWTGAGSQESMATVVGVNSPILTNATEAILKPAGSWVLWEGLEFVDARISATAVDFDNVIVRNNLFRDWVGSNTTVAMTFGYGGTGQSSYNE